MTTIQCELVEKCQAELDRVAAVANDTPLIQLASDQLQLHAKLECGGFAGNVKGRAATHVIRRAVERGDITSETTVVESTSGNFGLALAGTCRLLGLRFIPVIDPNINEDTERCLRLLCDQIVKVEKADANGGYLLTRRAKVAEMARDIGNVYVPNQYENKDIPEAYFQTLGPEILSDVGSLDAMIIAVSTGGTVTGISQYLRQASPLTKIIAVDVMGSVVFGGPPRPRKIPGMGSSIRPPILERAYIDRVIVVTEREIIEGCHELLRKHALFLGGSSGACYKAAQKLGMEQGRAGRKPRVVFVCPDGGAPYSRTIYNHEWVRRHRQGAEPSHQVDQLPQGI